MSVSGYSEYGRGMSAEQTPLHNLNKNETGAGLETKRTPTLTLGLHDFFLIFNNVLDETQMYIQEKKRYSGQERDNLLDRISLMQRLLMQNCDSLEAQSSRDSTKERSFELEEMIVEERQLKMTCKNQCLGKKTCSAKTNSAKTCSAKTCSGKTCSGKTCAANGCSARATSTPKNNKITSLTAPENHICTRQTKDHGDGVVETFASSKEPQEKVGNAKTAKTGSENKTNVDKTGENNAHQKTAENGLTVVCKRKNDGHKTAGRVKTCKSTIEKANSKKRTSVLASKRIRAAFSKTLPSNASPGVKRKRDEALNRLYTTMTERPKRRKFFTETAWYDDL